MEHRDIKRLLEKKMGYLGSQLIEEMTLPGSVLDIRAQTEILHPGQYIKSIPIVLSGLIKVFTKYEDRELLLYYIQPFESCIMSFSAGLKNDPSQIAAATEEDSTILLLPVNKVSDWVRQYPNLNQLFYQQYNLRYLELLTTINHLLFNKLDKRVWIYLKDKVSVTGKNPLKITHRQIASEVGTVREVITRLIKKLEYEGLVKQHPDRIEILDAGD